MTRDQWLVLLACAVLFVLILVLFGVRLDTGGRD